VMTADRRGPNVRVPPPTIFVVGVALGLVLERIAPLVLGDSIPAVVAVPLGWAAIVFGLALLTWALLTFMHAKTAIFPHSPARTIVVRGPYRYTRNPMYVSLAAIMVGIAVLTRNLWILALFPVMLVTLYLLVIRREEAYLTRAFGESYTSYTRRVRRWL